jgi:hypothetical protein
MTRKFQIVCLVLAGALLALPVFAQINAPALFVIGTWWQTVKIQGEPSFIALVTFNADGTLTDTDQADPAQHLAPGHGVWELGGGNTILFKLVKLRFDAQGSPNGYAEAVGTLTLQDKNDYKSSGSDNSYDNSGTLLGSAPFTTEGKRVTVSN